MITDEVLTSPVAALTAAARNSALSGARRHRWRASAATASRASGTALATDCTNPSAAALAAAASAAAPPFLPEGARAAVPSSSGVKRLNTTTAMSSELPWMGENRADSAEKAASAMEPAGSSRVRGSGERSAAGFASRLGCCLDAVPRQVASQEHTSVWLSKN